MPAHEMAHWLALRAIEYEEDKKSRGKTSRMHALKTGKGSIRGGGGRKKR